MAPRAYWKGYLKLSLVSCPIALYPATSEREKISFHQLNKHTGQRIKYRVELAAAFQSFQRQPCGESEVRQSVIAQAWIAAAGHRIMPRTEEGGVLIKALSRAIAFRNADVGRHIGAVRAV